MLWNNQRIIEMSRYFAAYNIVFCVTIDIANKQIKGKYP